MELAFFGRWIPDPTTGEGWLFSKRRRQSCLVALALALGMGCSAETPKTVGGHPARPTKEQGAMLYVANACHTCHGKDGRGATSMGETLKPPPRNLRDASTYRGGSEIDEIAKTLATGIPRTAMASYVHLDVEQRMALAVYVRSMQPARE